MSGLDLNKLAAALAVQDFRKLEPTLVQLDKFLTLRTYISGYALSDTDKEAWKALRSSRVAMGIMRKGTFANVTRWFNYLETAHPELNEALSAAKPKSAAGGKPKVNYNIGLKDTENGVVTRFPPEPS